MVNLQIHALLEVTKRNGQNYVGCFAATKGSGSKWDTCMVVGQVSAKAKSKRRGASVAAAAAAAAKKDTYLEVMYMNGRARWYPAAMLNVDIFTYDTVDDYLRDFNSSLPGWAGTFQHGIPAGREKEEPATPDFVQMWRDYYNL